MPRHPGATLDVMAPGVIANKLQVHHLEVLESTTISLTPELEIPLSGEARPP
jgi:hypothetical protein